MQMKKNRGVSRRGTRKHCVGSESGESFLSVNPKKQHQKQTWNNPKAFDFTCKNISDKLRAK